MQKFEVIGVYGFLLILALIYTIEFGNLLRFIISKLRGKQWQGDWKTNVIHILSMVGIACFLYGYLIEPYWVEVKTIQIETQKLIHAQLKLVQISDFHCDEKIRNETKIVRIINALTPDVIVFTGDALNTGKALPVFKSTLSALNAKLGKFAVRGNFDVNFWANLDLFGNTGFKVLDKESVYLTKDGEQFVISGTSCDYPYAYKKLLEPIPETIYSIFLYHYSDLVEDLEGLPVDLYLNGHTHGGQVALPFYGALVTLSRFGKKYEAGKYVVGDTIMYVNRGIGMEGGGIPRVRFWARPEITVFNIIPAKSNDGDMKKD
jgi:uncharacterized protein